MLRNEKVRKPVSEIMRMLLVEEVGEEREMFKWLTENTHTKNHLKK